MTARTRLDQEILELLGDDPELLAIADAVAETQTPTQAHRRRVRPVGLVAVGALVCAAALAVAFWPGSGSSGISGNTAYAAVGGPTRTLEVRLVDGSTPLRLSYDRLHGELSAIGRDRTLRLPAAGVPPAADTLAPSLERRYGADLGPVLSLVTEYPGVAKTGHLDVIEAPSPAWKQLEWVRYRSTLGYDVEIGLKPVALLPIAVTRAGSGKVVRLIDVYSTN
jgi:hypothetical protein